MHPTTPDFSHPIVLFGGSFDPLHKGHLHLAEGCLQQLPEVQSLFFVPSYQSPGKSPSLLHPVERLRLLALGLENTPFHIWDYEIQRAQVTYTIDLLCEAQRLGADKSRLYLLLGADTYAGLDKWKNAAQLRHYARLIVGNRPDNPIRLASHDDIVIQISPLPFASHDIREALMKDIVPQDALPPALSKEFQRLFLNSHNPYVKTSHD